MAALIDDTYEEDLIWFEEEQEQEDPRYVLCYEETSYNCVCNCHEHPVFLAECPILLYFKETYFPDDEDLMFGPAVTLYSSRPSTPSEFNAEETPIDFATEGSINDEEGTNIMNSPIHDLDYHTLEPTASGSLQQIAEDGNALMEQYEDWKQRREQTSLLDLVNALIRECDTASDRQVSNTAV